ncbi:hypothetical protein HDU67_005164 [Dinochytrium kinnereticum]|nr:hypothetical protein HDU67_005164 [Dinochytrium kinnereticum]
MSNRPPTVQNDGSAKGAVKFVKDDARAMRAQGGSGSPFQQRTVFKTVLDSPFVYKCMVEPLGKKRREQQERKLREIQKKDIEKTLKVKANEEVTIEATAVDEMDVDAKMKLAKKRKRHERRSLDVSRGLAEVKMMGVDSKPEDDNAGELEELHRHAVIGINGITSSLESAAHGKEKDNVKIAEYPEYAKLRSLVEAAVKPPSLPWLLNPGVEARAKLVQPSIYIQTRLKTLTVIPGKSSSGGRSRDNRKRQKGKQR